MKVAQVPWRIVGTFLLVLAFASTGFAQYNVLKNAGVETHNPFFWFSGQTGGTLSWTDSDAHSGEMSLQITKTATGNAASWITRNQATTYWNNVDAVLYDLGGWINIASGASASSTIGERIGILFTFQDGSGSDIVTPQFLAADAATTDAWQEVTGSVLLPSTPVTVIAEAIVEGGATGTVLFDDFAIGSDPWTMGFFGDGAETPMGWMNWTDGTKIGYANAVMTDMAYEGDYAVMVEELDTEDDEMVFYSIPVPANADTDYLVGVYARTDNMNNNADYYPTSAIGDHIAERANLCFFFHAGDIENDWSLTGGDLFLYLDQRTDSTGYVMYSDVVTSPSDATGLSVRARYNNLAEGTTYFDNFFAYELQGGSDLMVNGDLETVTPGFWMEGAAGGTLSWSTEQASAGTRSLKIEKTTTGTDASWESVNQANLYWNGVDAVLYDIGAQVYIETGVSASASTADERIGVVFHFEDGSGTDIVTPQFLAADPATVDAWQEVAGSVLLPSVPENVYAEAIVESNATGTVYFDEFNIGSDPWTMGFFGDNVETPTGWMNWTDGTKIGYADQVDVGEDAYSGTHVVTMQELDTEDDEMVYYSEPVAVNPDTWYEFSVMVKIDTLDPVAATKAPSAVLGDHISDRANFCFFFHAGDIETDWSLTGGDKFIYFDARADSTGWVEYRGVVLSPSTATGASVRARFNNLVVGTVHYDDFSIREMTPQTVSAPELPGYGSEAGLPSRAVLSQNYPNPFNASTEILFTVPQTGEVTLEVYDVLGRKVTTLVDQVLTAGQHKALFSTNAAGELSSGVYFYRLTTAQGTQIRRMVFMK
jgi:hypothetical protein